MTSEQLMEVFLATLKPINNDALLNYKINQVISKATALLDSEAGPIAKSKLVAIFVLMLNVYQREFISIDITVNAVLLEIAQPCHEQSTKNHNVKAFISDAMRSNTVNFMLFNDVLYAFGLVYSDIIKHLAATLALNKFKHDYNLDSPRFFGLNEADVLAGSINMLGQYDGPYIEIFYRGFLSNCANYHVVH